MTARPSDHPVSQPLLTNLLVRRLMDEANDTVDLPHAFEDTLIRHSDAGGCARKIGLKAAGYTASEEIDAAGVWVMELGSRIHEWLQEMIADEYGPLATIEARVRFDDLSSSGHCDALIELPNSRILYELKTKGGFAFDKAIGLDRKGYKMRELGPEGPGTGAKLQAALNALAADADEVIIGVIALEAVSKQLAEKVNFNDESRFLAEWRYTRAQWEPWAKAEKIRLQQVQNAVEHDVLPDRWAIDDYMQPIKLDPDGPKVPWQCSYCGHRTVCSIAGPGEPALPISGVPWPGEEKYRTEAAESLRGPRG